MAVVTPDLPEIFEEAFERAGLSMTTGYDLKTARRSFNLLTLEWQNRGLNLWTINSDTISLTAGTATYTMPTGTIDILEHQIRTGTGTNQVDTDIQRISVSTYAKISSKNTRGKPSQVFVQRLATSTTLTLWPVPDEADTYTLAHFYLLGTDGISSGLSGSAAVPPRFVPCLVAGLAYYIAMKKPEVANRVAPLKQEYEFQFELAANEDTDSSAIKFVPYDTFFLGG
tara:strand:- start:4066 stop:4746 length:681 start_codon:yes stop_codon:yes gene_type:complete